MGQTIENLAEKKLSQKTIFNNRFVVEICELVHVHYRNLRIVLSLRDFKEMAQGMSDSLKRWTARGCPENQQGTHIELCRKEVATSDVAEDMVKVNLNKNLYNLNEGKIFAEGAEFNEQSYIHLKIRDLRVELSLSDFLQVADAITEARDYLCRKV